MLTPAISEEDMPVPKAKRCMACGKTKPITAFDNTPRGLFWWCRKCVDDTASYCENPYKKRIFHEPPTEGMKVCNKCGIEKPVSEFHRHKRNPDGLTYSCKSCVSIHCKGWREENKEHKSELDRVWRQKNSARKKRNDKAYSAANKEKKKETQRKWLADNMDKKRATGLRYARRKRGGGEMFTEDEFKKLCDMFDNRCACCGEKKPLEADHIVPLKKGGRNIIENLQPLCRACNAVKHTKTVDYRSLEMTSKYSHKEAM